MEDNKAIALGMLALVFVPAIAWFMSYDTLAKLDERARLQSQATAQGEMARETLASVATTPSAVSSQ